jgi:hypothetical protein
VVKIKRMVEYTMRLLFGIQLYFYFTWALTSENINEWFLYVLGLWVTGYYLHNYNWELKQHYKKAICLYSLIIFMVVFCFRIIGYSYS